jgi:hypothetical protein
LKNSYIHNNPRGIYSTSSATNFRLEGCEISFNGTGGDTSNLGLAGMGHHLRFNYIHDVNGGIDVKDSSVNDPSQGYSIEIAYNWIEGAENGGYEVDLRWTGNSPETSSTADAIFVGNVVIHSVNGNHGETVSFRRNGTGYFSNNTFISASNQSNVLTVEAGYVIMQNSVVFGPGTLVSGVNPDHLSGSFNWLMIGTSSGSLTHTIFGNDPGFKDLAQQDYRPAADSSLLGQGNTTYAIAGIAPTREAVKLAVPLVRTDSGATIGAFSSTQ